MQNLCTFGKITFNFSKIGVIGLGNMGLPMALNLKKNGHEVYGQDVDISKAKFALQNDIVFVNRVKDLAKMVDTFVMIVPDTENSESVCDGDAGIC
jgi:3-hydroxyisobutyrate dehydrogenase-like beta-hydroxyacid dehydrogenase